jgi:ClpP class serine protease
MKAHALTRLLGSLYNKPHLIRPESFDVVLDYLVNRNTGAIQLSTEKYDQAPVGHHNNRLGVLMVDGSLTYKPVMTACGEVGTSYQDLVTQVEEMADAGVKTIVMEVNSGGGEASHCFEAAADIRALADENGIKLIGYADTLACSAAYALLSVCDEVVANPSATVGSIGCVVALMDTSKAMEQAGLKRVFITSGDNKVPFAADGSFKQEFLDEIQADVDRLNVEFATHVSQYTGLDVETIMGLEAKVFSAAEAYELGLVNAVMTTKQFAAHVAAKQGST